MEFDNTRITPTLSMIESSIYVFLGVMSFSLARSSVNPYLNIASYICVITAFTTFLFVCLTEKQNSQANRNKPESKERYGISMGSSLLSLQVLGVAMTSASLAYEHETMGNISYFQIYALLTSCSGMGFISSNIISLYYRPALRNEIVHSFSSLLIELLLSISIIISQNYTKTGRNQSSTGHFIAVLLYVAFQFIGQFLTSRARRKKNLPMEKDSRKKDVFTCSLSSGEWKMILCLNSLLFTDFFLRYVFIHSGPNSSTFGFLFPKTYIAVSHSGFVGCITGCISSSYLYTNIPYAISICSTVLISAISALSFVEWTLAIYPSKEWTILSSFELFQRFPRSIQWIIHFLTTSENDKNDCSSSTIARLPRGTWLIFWAFIFVLIVPISMTLSEKHISQQILKRQALSSSQVSHTKKSPPRHYSVVISRKFFHFVAIVIFTPCTIYAPSMMYLSYAIAVCILILLECLRLQHDSYIQERGSRSSLSNNLQKDSTTNLIEHCMNRLYSFYSSFLDEKENKEGFLFTHVSLVFGCALPLWIQPALLSQSLKQLSTTCSSTVMVWFAMLPFIGIVSLGVGDSFGAIIGTLYGRTLWSKQSKRTLEGSLGMFVSMIILSYMLFCWYFGSRSTIQFFEKQVIGHMNTLIVLTILEACTDQIDNICLPFIGCISLLLFSNDF